MSYRFTLQDVAYLSSAEGVAALATDLPLTESSLLADLTRLRRSVGERAAAVAETIRLRRRAAPHWATSRALDAADRDGAARAVSWLFTDDALQQSSPPPVAAHRATRLAGHVAAAGLTGVHDLTCSIGADLAALAAAGMIAVGSDIDPVRLAMARHNLATCGLTPRLTRADARTRTSRRLIRYADPARRDAAGRRTTQTIPTVAALDAADPSDPPVLRLPPGLDLGALGRGGESEIVSWRGTVREAVSWPESMATARRRATVLGDHGILERLTDADPAETDIIEVTARGSPPGRYLVDPDPAVVRAHLVQRYAARYGLARLDEHLAYLAGETRPPYVRSFEITDMAPYAERTVRDWIRRDRVGTLEIKQRGTSVIPDQLRRRLKPRGDRAIGRTLVIARIGRGPVAFWTRALPPPEPTAP